MTMLNLELITSTTKWLISHIHLMDLALAFLALFVFLSVHQRLTTRGPMLWPLVGMIPTFVCHVYELHEWNARTLVSCGATYRFRALSLSSFRGIVTSDPAKIEYMLKTNFHNFPKGEYYRERFRELLGDGIFNADGALWKEQRRVATSEMHTTRFVEYSLRTIQGLVRDKLLPLLEKHAKSPSQEPTFIDLQEWLLRFTFDNVCIVAFGVDPGCLSLDLPEIPFARAFEEATEYSIFRFLVPPFWWKPLRWLNLGKERKLKEAVKVVHEFADRTVKSRKVDAISNQHNDLLSRLIKLRQTGNMGLEAFSDQRLRDLCISFILAGRDTSSVALSWFFWLVYEHPHVEKKILKEINEITKSRQQGGNPPLEGLDSEYCFEADELERMVYLQAALTEAMRLYPPVPIDFKVAADDDVYPDGMRVSKGERVLYHIYAMGRMEAIWGKDCSEFRPERWVKEGKFVTENQFNYAVFNAGPRLCVGKKFAYVQMKMVAACVLGKYRVVVKQGHVVAPKVTTTLYMKNGLLVSFQPRVV